VPLGTGTVTGLLTPLFSPGGSEIARSKPIDAGQIGITP
jgi:hypothetical protein